ncbi:hypothetical protein [Kribbella amoyensis]|uniref:hypothetical protein n=1 Tax=Kribbella amoyensis TaxID=996641 RepID=UPI001EE2FD6D|nr:hypothetical protein [Kribbella amoyensis]
MEPLFVAEDEDRFGRDGQRPAVLGADDPRVGHRVGRQPGQVDGATVQRPTGVEAGQQEQVLDE